MRRSGILLPRKSGRPRVRNAQPTTVEGIRFASKKEAYRYSDLRLLETGGKITELKRQVRFPLHAAIQGCRGDCVLAGAIGVYVADFTYIDLEQDVYVVEEVKGWKTDIYKWKKKHFEQEYRQQIHEV